MSEHAARLREIIRGMGRRSGYREAEAISELDALVDELATAREEGRRVGFEKAREMAAKKTDALVRDVSDAVGLEQAGFYPKNLLEGCTQDARDLAKDIRAMQDERAGETPCSCGTEYKCAAHPRTP
jgi:hypothetical protein